MRLIYSSLLLALLLIPAVRAQTSGRNMEKEQALWAQLHLFEPSAVESFRQATVLLDKNDYKQASDAIDEEWTVAEDEIKKAEQLGLAPDVVKDFL